MRWGLLVLGVLAGGLRRNLLREGLRRGAVRGLAPVREPVQQLLVLDVPRHHRQAGVRPIHAGYTLRDSAFRPSWWGGYETNLLDAVNFCYVNFMRGVSPLTPEDPKSRALYEYLVSISPDAKAPALPFTVVKDIGDLPRGSTTRGAEVYRAACQTCHGETHSGKGRLTRRPRSSRR